MTNNSRQTPKIIEQNVKFLVPGMELARDVLLEDGKVLVSEGAIVSQNIINKLISWEITKVYIIAEVTINPIADPKVQQFINNYNKSVTVVQKAFESIRATQDIDIDTFEKTAAELTDHVSGTGNIIDQLYNLPKLDDYTFHHSVNVSVISALIASWLKYPADIVNAVSLTGLLHDVGKTLLPSELLNKPYKLSPDDYNLYKKHTAFGYELVKKIPDLAQSIISGVTDHHERIDGSGYPHGKKGDDIHPYAKIVAIADLYDEALTINREPDLVYSPYTSLEELRNNIFLFDPKACITFLDNMTNYLSGNIVALTDGTQGRVVFIHKERPSRSMVQMASGKVLDLSEQSELRIQFVVR